MRPIMTRDELASHKATEYGRDYGLADDGYDEMEINERRGWNTLNGWGRAGWDLGDWPYVVISTRTRKVGKVDVFGLDRSTGDTHEIPAAELAAFVAKLKEDDRDFFEVTQHPYELLQVCEGDHTVYTFDSAEDRDAAIDYLFVWYGINRGYDEWAVLGVTSHEGLDAGTLRVPEELRGPFSWARCDAEKGVQN